MVHALFITHYVLLGLGVFCGLGFVVTWQQPYLTTPRAWRTHMLWGAGEVVFAACWLFSGMALQVLRDCGFKL